MRSVEIKVRIKTLKLTVFGVIALILSAHLLSNSIFTKHLSRRLPLTVTAVSAAEIYPEFTCPCCDQPLNKEEPCCGAMVTMIEFIDEQIKNGLSKDEIMLAAVREFGLERLASDEMREQIRKLLADQAPENAPHIVFSQDYKNLGEVNVASGEVLVEFALKNDGGSDLVIDKMDSSCGCTSATIIYHGEEGPRFTMAGHGYDNPDSWQLVITPGDSATLRIYYDPTMHADLAGPVTRTVSIFSNDPVEFKKVVTITLDQIP